jgi:pantoate--beta-alanine ligase
MGALHEGHGSLIDRAREGPDIVIVSIFVNPTQFGPGEDFEKYPRDAEADLAFCASRGADAVFLPGIAEIYPETPETAVVPGRESEGLCGPFRPGHFRGVATVVLKLLNVVGPDRAYFGEKDLQQLAVIRRMVRDLDVPVEVVACPTVREADGLAVSSRNRYLSVAERHTAGVLYRALRVARQRVADGDTKASVILDAARKVIELEPSVSVDYLEMVDAADMQPIGKVRAGARIAGAIRVGGTRLIDNIECEAPGRRRRRK